MRHISTQNAIKCCRCYCSCCSCCSGTADVVFVFVFVVVDDVGVADGVMVPPLFQAGDIGMTASSVTVDFVINAVGMRVGTKTDNCVASIAITIATQQQSDDACVARAAPKTTTQQQCSVVLTVPMQLQRNASCIASAATTTAT